MKVLSIDFVITILVSTNFEEKIYDLILMIVDYLKKIVYYKHIKSIIDPLGLTANILDKLIRQHGLSNLIVIDQHSIFTSNL